MSEEQWHYRQHQGVAADEFPFDVWGTDEQWPLLLACDEETAKHVVAAHNAPDAEALRGLVKDMAAFLRRLKELKALRGGKLNESDEKWLQRADAALPRSAVQEEA